MRGLTRARPKNGALAMTDLVRSTGTQPGTIRLYEDIGLLPEPLRGNGNRRHYPGAQVARLHFIRGLGELGFDLDQIRTLLAVADGKYATEAAFQDAARASLAEAKAKIADLRTLCTGLGRLTRAKPASRAKLTLIEVMTARGSLAPNDNQEKRNGSRRSRVRHEDR